LFWTFRHGKQESGITLHQVDSGLDTGDIVLQSNVFIPDGLSSKEADELFAAQGTTLILEALSGLAGGRLARHAQEAGASYFGRPSEEDFLISTAWTAKRAFNFMRGTAEWEVPYQIQGDGFELLVRSAIAFHGQGEMDVPIVRQGTESWIQFKIGILHASIL
jgi:methionyl-tRNA formyltransferase